MYCSSCGKEIPDGSSFCNVCGARATILSSEEPQVTQRTASDEEIRNELKKYKKHTNRSILCLECGYQGILGISTEKILPLWKRLVLLFVMFLVICILYLALIKLIFWIVTLPLAYVFWYYIDQCYKICPNCKSKLR